MRLLYLLIPHLLIVDAALPKELIILARGLVYPKPQFERVEMLREICEEKREGFFEPFRSNLTKKEIKDELTTWADEMVSDGHNGTDDSVRVLIQHWEQWRKDAEERVFSLLKEAKMVYKEIINSSSHCTSNLSLCQDKFDLLPPRLHQVFSFLTNGGIQLSRSFPPPHPSNHSFTLPPSFNFTELPHHNWTIPEGNGSVPHWNSSFPSNGSHVFDDSSEETDLIDDIEREDEKEEEKEGFSFGNLAVYETWFNYWMYGTMNTSNWNATRDAIVAWKDGNNTVLPRFPTGLMASIVLPEERNWTLSMLNALNRGIEGASRIGLEVNASIEVSNAVNDLTRLFSSVTDTFKGNLVESHDPPLIHRSPSIPTGSSPSPTGISPVDWSSIQKRLMDVPSIESPVKENKTWMDEAQLMYRAMDNLGITDEIMGYLDSLYATAKQNGSARIPRSAMDLPDASGSRIDLIFGGSQNVIPTPPPSPSFSSILSNAGSMIGEKMSELEKLGTGLISHVMNAISGNQTMPNPATINQLPLLNTSSITNQTSWMGNLSGLLSNASSLIQNATVLSQNISLPSLPDFTSILTHLLSGSMNVSDVSSSASSIAPSLQPSESKDLSMNGIISNIFDSMDKVTSPPEEETTFSEESTQSANDSSKEDSSEDAHHSERSSSIRVSVPITSTTSGVHLNPSFPSLPSPSPLPLVPITATLLPLINSSTVSHSISPLPSSIPPSITHPSVQPSPIPSPPSSSLPPSSSPSTQRPAVSTNPPDLRDILKGNGFNIPDIKNLTSVVDSIDRLNEFLSNQTKMMIESITRTIEEAFRVGESKENMMNAVNATIEGAKEVIHNLTEIVGSKPVNVMSWNEIKNHIMMTPNVSRDDYEYHEYDYEEMEEEVIKNGNGTGSNSSEEEEEEIIGEGNWTVVLPSTNVSEIAEEDERLIKSTFMFYDKVNCTLSALFSIVANESLSIPDTKRALNAVYWNSTLIQRQMISFMIRNAEIPSIDIKDGVKLRGSCNGTGSWNVTERESRPIRMDETAMLLMN